MVCHDDLLQVICDGLGICGQHGGLVHHPYPLKIFGYIEAFGESSGKLDIELFARFFTSDVFREFDCFFHIIHHNGWCMNGAVGERGPGFFVGGLSMHHNGISFLCDLCGAVPDLFYKRAGGVIFFDRDAEALKFLFNGYSGSERRDQHHVIRCDFCEVHNRIAISIHDEAHA